MRFLNGLIWTLSFFLILILCGEMYFASKGANLQWRSEAGQKLLLINPTLRSIWRQAGWGPVPGTSESYEDPSVMQTVWANGMRACRADINKKAPINVAVIGCSRGFGEGVRDDETFVWLLNDRYPEVCFDNYSVSGWGALQIDTAINEILKNKKYDLVVYPIPYCHITRNVCVQVTGYLQQNGQYVVNPYTEKVKEGEFKFFKSCDLAWPFENNLLSADMLKRMYYGYAVSKYPPMYEDREKLFVMLKKINEDCRKYNTDFLLCSIDCEFNDKLASALSRDISYLNIDLDNSNVPEYRVLGNTQFHPNAKAHAYWAEKFSEWFNKQKYLNKVK